MIRGRGTMDPDVTQRHDRNHGDDGRESTCALAGHSDCVDMGKRFAVDRDQYRMLARIAGFNVWRSIVGIGNRGTPVMFV